jgi:chromosome segregation ATPase
VAQGWRTTFSLVQFRAMALGPTYHGRKARYVNFSRNKNKMVISLVLLLDAFVLQTSTHRIQLPIFAPQHIQSKNNTTSKTRSAIMGDQAHQRAIAIVNLNDVPQAMGQAPQTLESALARIRELKAANTTLDQEYQELQEKYRLQGEDHDRAIANEDTVEEEKDLLQQQLQDAQSEKQRLKNELENSKRERDDFQKQLLEVEGANEVLRSTMAMLEGDVTVSRFRHRIQELERAVREAQDQRAERIYEMQENHDRYRRQLVDQNVRINVLRRRVVELKGEIRGLRGPRGIGGKW